MCPSLHSRRSTVPAALELPTMMLTRSRHVGHSTVTRSGVSIPGHDMPLAEPRRPYLSVKELRLSGRLSATCPRIISAPRSRTRFTPVDQYNRFRADDPRIVATRKNANVARFQVEFSSVSRHDM